MTLPQTVWVGLMQSVKGLKRERLGSLGKEFCLQNSLWTQASTSTLPGARACWPGLQLSDLSAPTTVESILYNESFSVYTYAHPIGSISLEKSNTGTIWYLSAITPLCHCSKNM